MATPEDLWIRLKSTAQALPASRLDREHAESLVRRIAYQLHMSPAPPREAIEFYARELQQMAGKINGNDVFTS
jgi:hypothetical protein